MDLILHGGTVRESAATEPTATAIGFANGMVAAIGTDEHVLALATDETAVHDLAGAAVVPGLIDSHAHPLWGARVTRGVDLDGLTTLAAVRDALAAEAATLADGEWLLGWNLDYAAFASEPMHRSLLDAVAGDRPAFVMCFDLHTALASTSALAAAGIDGAVAFDDASSVLVDAEGVPTGELREPSAYGLVEAAVPELADAEERALLVDVLDRFSASGLTAAAVMDGGEHLLDVLESIEAEHELPVRLDVFLWHRPGDDDDAVGRRIAMHGRAGRRWRVRGIKLFSDGVIDTGTAWLTTPDACGDGAHGFWPDWSRYAAVVRRYSEAGLAITTHACGDGGVRAILDVYEQLPGPAPAPAPRIEHLEVLEDAEVARVAAAGVTASMQPLHMQWRHADGSDSWAQRLGHRAAKAFRAGSLVREGALVVLGSDWPVATFDPVVGWDFATLRTAHGHAFEPEERLSPAEALAGYTSSAAAALGDPARGTLAVGALGDATVCSVDPVATGSLIPIATVVGGSLGRRPPTP